MSVGDCEADDERRRRRGDDDGEVASLPLLSSLGRPDRRRRADDGDDGVGDDGDDDEVLSTKLLVLDCVVNDAVLLGDVGGVVFDFVRSGDDSIADDRRRCFFGDFCTSLDDIAIKKRNKTQFFNGTSPEKKN